MAHVIEIFRSGRHVSASGEVVSFSDADLDAIVRSYDTRVHEAPLVVGHPKSDAAPAYGWAKALVREGSKLKSVVSDVDPAFAEGCLRTRRYAKVSASFYKPDSPNNPKPGAYYLRHIGLLGAQPPAVKGLKEASFADGGADTLTIDFADGDAAAAGAGADAAAASSAFTPAQLEALQKMIADAVIAATGAAKTAPASGASTTQTADHTEAADVIAAVEKIEGLTPEQLEALKKRIAEAFADAAAAGAGNAPTVDASEASIARRALSIREADIVKRERAARRKEHEGFLDGLLRDGRPLPASREKTLAFLELLEGDASVSFGEGEKRSPAQIFREDFLARLPKQVITREVSGGGDVDYAEARDEVDLAEQAVAYQADQAAKGITVSMTDAVHHVAKKGR